jgi:hypothetical protein
MFEDAIKGLHVKLDHIYNKQIKTHQQVTGVPERINNRITQEALDTELGIKKTLKRYFWILVVLILGSVWCVRSQPKCECHQNGPVQNP